MSPIAPERWKRRMPPKDVQDAVLRGRLLEEPLSAEDDDAHLHHPSKDK